VPANYTAANVNELIAAIGAANATPEADTISLSAGATYTLTAVDNTAGGPNGLPGIVTDEYLTVLGNGATIEWSTAAGTPAFRLFAVDSGGALTLNDVTLQGGLTGMQGGAISSARTLTLDRVTATNNVAQGTPGGPSPWGVLPGGSVRGGAIYASGHLTMTNCTVTNNHAVGGQGYVNDKNGHVLSTGEGGSAFGGGLYVDSGAVSIFDTAITANTARGGEGGKKALFGGEAFGGGVFVGRGASASLLGVTITGNSAQGGNPKAKPGAAGQGVGGGIYIMTDLAGMDAFTIAHLTGNYASTSDDDAHGPYGQIP
jgi:hypothetical protein